ncbi:MAG: DUF4846 domain-containing protein [Paludibacteraceae bacterium]
MTKRVLITVFVCIGLISILGGYAYYSFRVSNPFNANTISDIPLPVGYERVQVEKGSFGEYLRSLPLKPNGTKVYLYRTRKLANYQWLSTGVVDLPLLSNDEQCADVCMHLWGEYMFHSKKYGNLSFTTVNGTKLQYSGGGNRRAFEQYMRKVYGLCNTTSLHCSLHSRELKDMKIGDVFVYPHRRIAGKDRYGHAVMVADMAVNRLTGKKIFLLVEGNTPARDIHILRHLNPFRNPWYQLDENDQVVRLLCFRFTNGQLKHF